MDTEAVLAQLPHLLEGFWLTVQLTLGGAAGAFVIAIGLGLASSAPSGLVRFLTRVIVEFFRGTSLLVQLFWFYYVLPLFGLEMPALMCGIVALSLNYGAYGAEVVRGSIASVDRGQREAVRALSLSRARAMRRVIFPQAWALMVPSLANLLVQLLKGSAIAGFITISDLAFQLDVFRQSAGTFLAYSTGLVIYFLFAYLLTVCMNLVELRAKARLGQGPGLRESLRAGWQAFFTRGAQAEVDAARREAASGQQVSR